MLIAFKRRWGLEKAEDLIKNGVYPMSFRQRLLKSGIGRERPPTLSYVIGTLENKLVLVTKMCPFPPWSWASVWHIKTNIVSLFFFFLAFFYHFSRHHCLVEVIFTSQTLVFTTDKHCLWRQAKNHWQRWRQKKERKNILSISPLYIFMVFFLVYYYNW